MAKTNSRFLLNETEAAEFKQRITSLKKRGVLKKKEVAEIFCITPVTFSGHLKNGHIIRLWPRHLDLIEKLNEATSENNGLYKRIAQLTK